MWDSCDEACEYLELKGYILTFDRYWVSTSMEGQLVPAKCAETMQYLQQDWGFNGFDPHTVRYLRRCTHCGWYFSSNWVGHNEGGEWYCRGRCYVGAGGTLPRSVQKWW
jgi:hypothetical protein